MARSYKKRRYPSEADKHEVYRLHVEHGWSLTRIAKKLDLSITPVQRMARAHGIRFAKKTRWSNILRARVAQAYADGESSTVISKRYKTCAMVILKIVRDEGGEVRHKVRELSEADGAEIERRYLAGEAACEIAPSYDVYHKRILALLRRRGVRIRKNTWVWWTDCRSRRFHFRSKWEVWAAQILDAAGLTWDYEHERYAVVVGDKLRHYTPDFWVWDGDELRTLIDVKGRQDREQKRKIELFQEQYPELPFELWGAEKLRALGCKVSPSLRGDQFYGASA